jgi:precorrin-3B C17-methyltransferase
MAAAVFEAIETGPAEWRALDIRVEPGVTAMLAAAAEIGAPLGGDFCAISLSDNLKSWTTITRRLEAACAGDFVIALYNPLSRARPHQLGEAFDILRRNKPPSTIIVMVRAAGSGEMRRITTTLDDVDPDQADMRTLVMIGSSATRLIARDGRDPWVYTPRREEGAR